MIKQFAKLLIVASALGLVAQPVSVFAAEKAAKQPSCKEEAKQAGIKDKAEMKKFVNDCKETRKAAKKQGAAAPKG